MNFFKPLEAHVQIGQKVLKYTPVQKLEMFLVAVLAGAKAVSQSETTVRLDPALRSTFGLPGCAEPSASRQDFIHEMLVLDLSPLPVITW